MPLAGFCSRCLSATAVDRAAGSRAWTSFFVLGASCRVLNHAATSGRVTVSTGRAPRAGMMCVEARAKLLPLALRKSHRVWAWALSSKARGVRVPVSLPSTAQVVEPSARLRVRMPAMAKRCGPAVDRIPPPVDGGAVIPWLTRDSPVREGGLEPPPSNTRTSTSS